MYWVHKLVKAEQESVGEPEPNKNNYTCFLFTARFNLYVKITLNVFLLFSYCMRNVFA